MRLSIKNTNANMLSSSLALLTLLYSCVYLSISSIHDMNMNTYTAHALTATRRRAGVSSLNRNPGNTPTKLHYNWQHSKISACGTSRSTSVSTCDTSKSILSRRLSSSSSLSSSSHAFTKLHLYATGYEYGAEEYEDTDRINRSPLYQRDFAPPPSITQQDTTTTTTTSTATSTSTTAPPETETIPAPPSTQSFNPPPKIVVLGASGKIGRRIIQQLMAQTHVDMTVVAFVRDYEKACEVLYDELILDRSEVLLDGDGDGQGDEVSSGGSNEDNISHRRRRKGPKLQLIVGDLVPPQEVYGYSSSLQQKRKKKNHKHDNHDNDEEDENVEYAVSASRFYQNNMEDYNFQTKELDQDDEYYTSPNLPLHTALSNATVIINTVGSVRTTFPFADYVWKPWRLFRSPNTWCKDRNHPHYVNTMVMEKVLGIAEEEQERRNEVYRLACVAALAAAEGEGKGKGVQKKQQKQEVQLPKLEKIRIIRISDLLVAHPPWDFVTLLTNIGRSVVFATQERCEKLLAKSSLVDTIILRPGDLTDDVRNTTTTSIQTATSGYLPYPAYVGRDDIASLAVMASQYDLDAPIKQKSTPEVVINPETMKGAAVKSDTPTSTNYFRRRKNVRKDFRNALGDDAKHWVVGVRWAGKDIMQGQQGSIRDGHVNANDCMKSIIKQQKRKATVEKRKEIIRRSTPLGRMLATFPLRQKLQTLRNQRLKPYTFFVLLPMLLFIYPMLMSILWSVGKRIPFIETCAIQLFAGLQPLWTHLIRLSKDVAWQQMLASIISKVRRVPLVR